MMAEVPAGDDWKPTVDLAEGPSHPTHCLRQDKRDSTRTIGYDKHLRLFLLMASARLSVQTVPGQSLDWLLEQCRSPVQLHLN